MVKKKKIKATTDNSGWVEPKRKKVRKARKPMTEEQKQAAVARLEKARAKRAENNPDYGMSGIHESLRGAEIFDIYLEYPFARKRLEI